MVVHLDLDLTQVIQFNPNANLRGSIWPNKWLDKIQQKLVKRMSTEAEEQLQLTLKHLWLEANEVITYFISNLKIIS